jgi:FkbM family methyltransferase
MNLHLRLLHYCCYHWPFQRGRDFLMRCFLAGSLGDYLAKFGPWITTRGGWKMKANMGNDYSSQMLKMFGELEPATTSFLLNHLTKNGVFLDVGANVGFFSLLVANLRPEAKVIAFEPNPAIAAHLADSIHQASLQDRIQLHGLAASDSAGIVHFVIESLNSGHSRLSGSNRETQQSLKVETICLDDWLPSRMENQNLNAVKIDVEGAELRVLKGMKQLLRQHKPILVVEAYDEHLQEFGDSLTALKEWIKEANYREHSYIDGNLYLIHQDAA